MPKASTFGLRTATQMIDSDTFPMLTNAGENVRLAVSEARALVGPGWSDTVNAYNEDEVTDELKVQAAIGRAVSTGKKWVFIPSSMLPYDASLVTFNPAIQMVAEGGPAWNLFDVRAYGAFWDDATDDIDAVEACIAAIPVSGGEVAFPAGAGRISRSLVRPGTPTGPVRFRGVGLPEIAEDGIAPTTIRYTGTGAAVRVGTDDSGASLPQGQGFHLQDIKIDCIADADGILVDNVSGFTVSQVLVQGYGTGFSTKTGIKFTVVQTAALDGVRVFQFAVGIEHVSSNFDITLNNCLVDFNDVNVLTGTTSGMASVRYNNCTLQRPTTYCVDVVRAGGLSFNNCYFESNGTGKRVFRIGATAAVLPEGIQINGGTMQGGSGVDSEYAIELRRCRGLTIQNVNWDNYTNGLIENVATDVGSIVLINNRPFIGSRGTGATISSYTGVTFTLLDTGQFGLKGIFTAAMVCGTSGTITLSSDQLEYRSFGGAVHVTGFLVVGSASSPLGSLTVTGLPFAVSNRASCYAGVNIRADGLGVGATTAMQGWCVINTTTLRIERYAAGVASDAAAYFTAGATAMISFTYFSD